MVKPQAAKPVKPDAANRYVCVHGHFYQPPRENPWLETVEVQDSAAPYHDWNERITAESYAPNGAARITNRRNEIIRIVNNYSRMSFNFGPTLLKWMAEKAPRTYRMILDADKTSAQRYSGHGSAMAQVYNHMIMPLANRADAITQIRWGIADFEHRFGRRPEGMWLAETAVSRSVLDLMAAEGIKFTLLAPSQCARVRKLAGNQSAAAPDDPPASALADDPPAMPEAMDQAPVAEAGPAAWNETPNATVDPTHPYLIKLDQGRSIAVFFYDGPPSRAIAFEGLLNSGESFGSRLLDGFHSNFSGPQLSHVATDGESYGHHHRYGEMALAYAMHWIEDNGHAHLTNYGEFLEKFPPEWEAEVVEDTSWSCVHGVERWRSDCGCNGGKVGWNQKWRGPLRDALDFLRDAVAPLCEARSTDLFHNLWDARNDYIRVVLDRSSAGKDTFFTRHAAHDLSPDERIAALQLMELQRHAQLMYTSCGWFFDEISGIETVQVIAYAGRVLQLANDLFGMAAAHLEQTFLEILGKAKSNVPEIGDGAELYRRYVEGLRVNLDQVGAHYAISSVFRSYPEDAELFCYELHRDFHELLSSGRGKVALGRAALRSRITEESESFCYAVLHLGDQNLSGAVRNSCVVQPGEIETFDAFTEEVRSSIRRANLPEVIRSIDRYFGTLAYSLTSLFSDEQQRILRTILDRTLSEMEESLRKIYEDHASLLRFLTESGMAPPPALALAANFALNASLRRSIEADNFDPAEIQALLARAAADQVALDSRTLSFAAGERMKGAMVRLEAAADSDYATSAALNTALSIASTLHTLPLDVNLWQAQNIWNDIFRRSDLSYWSPEFKVAFKKLGRALYISVDELVTEEGVTAF